MWRRVLAYAIGACAALIPANGAATGSADLAITMKWIGKGVPRARLGQTASFATTATNLGPDAASGARIRTNEGDQLNFVSLVCSVPDACSQPGTEPGPGFELAPGETVTGASRPTSHRRRRTRTRRTTTRPSSTRT